MSIKLGEVQETMLIPLAIKANETLRKNPRIKDEKAVEIIKKINIDTEKYDKFMSHEGVVARTIMFDRTLKEYIKQYPDAVCVNLGCGLDNRFKRVDNGKIIWYNLDLPDTIAVRKQFFKDSKRVHTITSSVLDKSWMKDIPTGNKIIFIAEGLLMYFSKEQVKEILLNMASFFSDFIFITELMPPFTSKMSKHHDTVKNTNATFGWGTKTGHELEALCPGLRLVTENSFNIEMKKYTIRGKLFASIPGVKNCNNRLAVFEYSKP